MAEILAEEMDGTFNPSLGMYAPQLPEQQKYMDVIQGLPLAVQRAIALGGMPEHQLGPMQNFPPNRAAGLDALDQESQALVGKPQRDKALSDALDYPSLAAILAQRGF